MRIILFIYGLISFTFLGSLQAQQPAKNIDSLLSVYNNLADTNPQKLKTANAITNHYRFLDVEQAKKYALVYMRLAEQIGDKTDKAGGVLSLGNIYDLYNQLDSAKWYYQLGYERYVALRDTQNIGKSLDCLANVAYKKGNLQESADSLHSALRLTKLAFGEKHTNVGKYYSSLGILAEVDGHKKLALKYYLESLKIFEGPEHRRRRGFSLKYLGKLEQELGHNDKAIGYLQEAIKIQTEFKQYYFVAEFYEMLGLVYAEMEDFEKAEKHYLQGIEYAKQSGSDEILGSLYSNFSMIYTQKKQFDKAIALLEKSEVNAKKSGFLLGDLGLLIRYGWTYLEMNQPAKALPYFNRVVHQADSVQAVEYLEESYGYRSKAYEKMGNTRLALEDFKQHQVYKDSLLNKTKIQQIEELRILHDLEKKEQSIELQKNQIKLLEKEATLSRLQRWFLGLGLGLSFIILGLGYYAFQQKLKRKQQKNEQQKMLYENELAFKKRELTAHALHLAKKNEVLNNLKQKAISLNAIEKESRGYQKLINTIDFDLKDEDNWENFKKYFEQIHANFNTKVMENYPKVTTNDLRLMALLKMNLSSKEIANILNISAEGVKKARQRLRKKMELMPSDSLEGMIMEV